VRNVLQHCLQVVEKIIDEGLDTERIQYTCSDGHVIFDEVSVVYWFLADFIDMTQPSDYANNRVRAWVTDQVGELIIARKAIDLQDENTTSLEDRAKLMKAAIENQREAVYKVTLDFTGPYAKLYIPR
jgi:hypothetical protein